MDLGQKKDSYFANCCHNWPTAGKNCCIIMSILEWLENFISPELSTGSSCLIVCLIFSVHYVRIRLYEAYSYIYNMLFLFLCSSDECAFLSRTLVFEPENVDWSKYPQCMAIHFTKNRRWRHFASFREICLCHCQSKGVCFTNNALRDLSPFINYCVCILHVFWGS